MDELQAELRKLELQASHIQHINRGCEDEMGGNVDDDNEDSDVSDAGDLSLEEDSGEEVIDAVIYFRWRLMHRDFATSTSQAITATPSTTITPPVSNSNRPPAPHSLHPCNRQLLLALRC